MDEDITAPAEDVRGTRSHDRAQTDPGADTMRMWLKKPYWVDVDCNDRAGRYT